MITSRSTKLLALSTITVLSFAACGSKEEAAGPATSSAAAASPTADASSAGGSAQASTEAGDAAGTGASDAASTEPSDGGAASGGGKAYTDAQLSAMLKGAKVNGVVLEAAPAQLTAQFKKVNPAELTAQAMKSSTVTPEGCKTATVANAKLMPGSTPLAVAGGNNLPFVLVRSLPSAEDATKLVQAANTTASACKSYTMTMTQAGQTMTSKGANTVIAVDSPSSQDEFAYKAAITSAGRTQSMNTAIGHVDNVFIQLTDMGGQLTPAQLNTALEDVAKAIAAKK